MGSGAAMVVVGRGAAVELVEVVPRPSVVPRRGAASDGGVGHPPRDHDVGAVIERAGQEGRGKGRVDHQRQAGRVGDGGDRLEVGHLQCRVRHGLAEQGAGVVVDGRGKVRGVVRIDEADLDSQRRQDVVELGVGAAVEVARRDDVVPAAVARRIERSSGIGEHLSGDEPPLST